MDKLIIKSKIGKLFIETFIEGVSNITKAGDYLFICRKNEPLKKMIGIISLN